MDKRIIVGLVAGLILGIIEMFAFKSNYMQVVIPAILGAIIGFVTTKNLPYNTYLVSALLGAAFFVLIALQSGKYLDDVITGAITGLVIAFLIPLVGKQLG